MKLAEGVPARTHDLKVSSERNVISFKKCHKMRFADVQIVNCAGKLRKQKQNVDKMMESRVMDIGLNTLETLT